MSPQSTIAHYRIVSKIGEGGMGEVYRATDTKLNRDVAIKILPESFAQDPDRMARFAREAQVLASLNHPNIAAIYGIEENAIVMELVEGEDVKGPLPLATALDYARQITLALEAAHERGIIHRDLKPANIKVTPEGVVKLLDFGLAKASESSAVSGSPTISPTLSLTMTQAGVILGTAAYMSPEQARGKPVDRRADIWAFGVVLYEMLTGRVLFGGDTLTDTIASVVKAEPDWAALPVDTPPHVRWLLERCLRKDTRTRLQAIGDARMLMEEPPGAARDRAGESPSPRWLRMIATAIVVASVTAATMWWFRAKPMNLVSARFDLTLPEGTGDSALVSAPQAVPSPDGRYLAFIAREARTGKNYLWVRPLDSLSAQRLDRSEGANFPFWSPDGQFVAFFADQKLKKIAVSGGFAQTICDTGEGSGDGGTWNQSDTIVFAPAANGPLMRVPATGGGRATPATTLDTNRTEVLHSWPQFLPDGRHFVYLARSVDSEKSGIYVQELGAPKGNLVLKSVTRATFAPPGYLLFARDATLFAQRLDPKDFHVQGDPVPVVEEITQNTENGLAAFAVSSNGVLAYRRGAIRSRQLTWYDREGKRLGLVGEPGEYTMMRISPDEKHVALQRRRGAVGLDTWIMDLGSGILTRTTFDLKQTRFGPVWSPDSRRMVVSLEGGGLTEIAVASGALTVLSSEPNTISANDWSPDGRFLLCANLPPTQISLLPLSPAGAGGERKMQMVLDTPYSKYGLRFSPDGQWAAYTSDESGEFEVYVASFPSFSDKRRVSGSGGYYPFWRKDGKELFFTSRDRMVVAVEVKTGSKLEVGVPKPLFKISVSGFAQFAVLGDGKRFLVNELTGQSAEGQITVVLNWAAEMKQ
jgi:eukaryotic-like serine/threonine-protein kinase